RFSGVSQVYETPNVCNPKFRILSNGEWSTVVSDSGLCGAFCGGDAIVRFGGSLLEDTKGIFAFAGNGSKILPATAAPVYTSDGNFRACMGNQQVTFLSQTQSGDFSLKSEICVARDVPAQLFTVCAQCKGGARRETTVLFGFEPVLTARENDLAHPAFSNLF